MFLTGIQSNLREAQLNRDTLRVETLRLLLSEIHNAQIQKGEELSDTEVLIVIRREIKKRKEAAESFKHGGRHNLAEKEESEAEVLARYLPAEMSDEELTGAVEEAINVVGAKSISDIGKVMPVVMGKVAGRADGARVSALVREKLN